MLISSVVFSISLGNTHQGRDTFLLLSIPSCNTLWIHAVFVIKSNFLQLSGVALMYWLHEPHEDHWSSWWAVFKRSIKHTIKCDSSHTCTIYPCVYVLPLEIVTLFLYFMWSILQANAYKNGQEIITRRKHFRTHYINFFLTFQHAPPWLTLWFFTIVYHKDRL